MGRLQIDLWATALILSAISWFGVEFVLAVVAG
jgi:hypothetical protein